MPTENVRSWPRPNSSPASSSAPETWGDLDVTEPYQAARTAVFDSCRRVEVPLRPGHSVLLHRHVIHGVAPWADGAKADPEGRAIAYFRPWFEDVARWV